LPDFWHYALEKSISKFWVIENPSVQKAKSNDIETRLSSLVAVQLLGGSRKYPADLLG
jgi:hypothetical protein